MIAADKRIELMTKLGEYMLSDEESWLVSKERAVIMNAWFTPFNIDLAAQGIAQSFLQKDKLEQWLGNYPMPAKSSKVGIVMAGNIPLVGFHDFLCGFMSGHELFLKLSSKDEVMLRHLVERLIAWEPELAEKIQIADRLNNCHAYIATGSNNTARYFEQYFSKYPHIIRRNRTSVAILTGDETDEELRALGKDVFTYFGLGCRNVTQICVPVGYDFSRLLEIFRAFNPMEHHKYKNNYDYHFAIYMLNRVPYLTNDSLLLVENDLPFSAVSVLHYRYYDDRKALIEELKNSSDIQTIVGRELTPFGTAQQPTLFDYADGVDIMAFLCSLK